MKEKERNRKTAIDWLNYGLPCLISKKVLHKGGVYYCSAFNFKENTTNVDNDAVYNDRNALGKTGPVKQTRVEVNITTTQSHCLNNNDSLNSVTKTG